MIEKSAGIFNRGMTRRRSLQAGVQFHPCGNEKLLEVIMDHLGNLLALRPSRSRFAASRRCRGPVDHRDQEHRLTVVPLLVKFLSFPQEEAAPNASAASKASTCPPSPPGLPGCKGTITAAAFCAFRVVSWPLSKDRNLDEKMGASRLNSKSRRRHRRPRVPLAGAATALIGLLLLLGFWNGFWLTDLLAHFRVHLAGLLLVSALVLLLQRRGIAAAIVAFGALGMIAITLPFADRSAEADGSNTVYKALHFNLSETNRRMPALINLLDAERPDLVFFCKYTGSWNATVGDSLKQRYPFHVIEPRRDLVGLVLLSRYPIESSELINVPGSARPILHAEVNLPDGRISVIGMHAESPMSPGRFASRNLAFQRAASLAVASANEAIIVLGDFNSTPWSGNFSVLTGGGGLKHPASRWRLHATWPSWLGPAGIPIDHVLLSPQLLPVNYRVAGNKGSEHLPVICEFVFAEPAPENSEPDPE